jgi:hypothetical protein
MREIYLKILKDVYAYIPSAPLPLTRKKWFLWNAA